MSPEKYKQLAADFRRHMEDPDVFENQHSVFARRVSAYLPGGEKRSVVANVPDGDDLSHLNPPHWKKGQRGGRNNGRKKR